jgi:uncharacterized protein
MSSSSGRIEKRISRSDMLLLLLYAPGPSGQIGEPIRGKTRLQKELFLTQKNLRDAGIFTYYPFQPYKLGPYSKELYEDIEWMEYEGVLKTEKLDLGEYGICAEFRITDKGRREIETKIQEQSLKKAFEIATETKNRFNALNVVELVRLTHELYPDYVAT